MFSASLATAGILALAIWLSRSVLAVIPDTAVSGRVGFVRPLWELGIWVLACTLCIRLAQPTRSQMVPLATAGLLLLPWLPVPMPSAMVVWSEGLMPLLWAGVCLGALVAARDVLVVRVRRAQWLTNPRRAPITAAAVTVVLALAAAKQVEPRIPGGDEPHYLVIAQTLLNHGNLGIEATHREEAYRGYFDGDLAPHYLRRGKDGEIYSVHAPGLPVLVLPAFVLAGYAGVVVFVSLLAAVGTALAWRAGFLVTQSAASAWFGWAAVTLSAPFFFHSFTVYPDIVASVIVMLGIWPLLPGATFGLARWALQGVLLSVLPWLHTRYSLLAVTLAVVAFASILRGPDRMPRTFAFVSVPVLAAGAWLGFFKYIYGTVDPRAPYGTATQTALAQIPAGITGLLVDQQFGVVANAPIYALAALGIVILWRRRAEIPWPGGGQLAVGLLLFGLPYVAGVTSYAMWWGGWSAPGRFAVPVLLPLAIALAAFWRWPIVPAARPVGVALLVCTGFITGVLLLVDRGALLYDVRGPRALWLDWASASVDLAIAWPSVFRDGYDGALLRAFVWLAWIAAAWTALAVCIRRRRADRGAIALATTTAMMLAVTGAVVTASSIPAAVPRREDPTQLRVLRQFDSTRRPLGISFTPLGIGHATAVLPRLAFSTPLVSHSPEQPLFRYGRLPAGNYRLQIDANQAFADQLSLVIGRSRQGEIAILNPEQRHVKTLTTELELPLQVYSLSVYGEQTAHTAGLWATLTPLETPAARSALRSERALAAKAYGPHTVFFLDDHAYPEPTGFWIPGGAETRIVVAQPDLASDAHLLVRNGPKANRGVIRVGRWSATLSLDPGEERTLPVPRAFGSSATLLRLATDAGFRPSEVDEGSTDHRWLGCWIELR